MLLKYWRVLLLLVTVLGAIFAVGLKFYPYGRNGVEIAYVSGESPAKGLLEQGMMITKFNGQQINGMQEWNRLAANASGLIKLMANGQNIEFERGNATSLGIEVMDLERTNLEFGLDIRGGTRIILSPSDANTSADTIEQVMATLQTRANLYGLKEIKFTSIRGNEGYFIQVEAAGVGRSIVDDLLSSQGKFDGRITKPVYLTNNAGEMQLGQDKYPVKLIGNESVQINNTVVQPNATFRLEGIGLQYLNRTGNTLMFLADVLESKDVEIVFYDTQHSGLMPLQDGAYRFYFTIQVSTEAAKKFAKVTAGPPKYIDIDSGEEYIKDTEILLLIDGKVVSRLRIASDLQGQEVQTPQITGSRSDMQGAIEEKLRLQTILRSGALPTSLKTDSVDVISPTLGSDFLTSAMYAAIIAALVVMAIIYVRYRKLKIAIPLMMTGLTEVVIILGIASTGDAGIWAVVLLVNVIIVGLAWWKKQETDIYAWIGAILIPMFGMMSWTMDLASIGGIIAAIGTGVDQLIIITDETVSGRAMERRTYTIKEKIKRAFFIIFGAASTTIGGMLPLLFLGIGMVRGFAITTIIGMLVGILVTRPAYAAIVERIAEKQQR